MPMGLLSAAMGSQFNNLSWMSTLGVLFPPLYLLPFLSILSRFFPKGVNIWTWAHGNQINPSNLPSESRTIPKSSLGNASVIPGTAKVRVPLDFRGISSKDGKSVKIPAGKELTTTNERSIMDGKWWIKVKNSKGEEGWVEEDKLIINVQDPLPLRYLLELMIMEVVIIIRLVHQ